MLVCSIDDFLWYMDLALDSMVAITRDLGDELANRCPQAPGANSTYAILTHCVGVIEFWGGCVVADRTIERDRDAEFAAVGPVETLFERVRTVRERLGADLVDVDSLSPPAAILPPEDASRPFARTRGGVMLHIMEELFQHLGQMELTRDWLLASAGPSR